MNKEAFRKFAQESSRYSRQMTEAWEMAVKSGELQRSGEPPKPGEGRADYYKKYQKAKEKWLALGSKFR